MYLAPFSQLQIRSVSLLVEKRFGGDDVVRIRGCDRWRMSASLSSARCISRISPNRDESEREPICDHRDGAQWGQNVTIPPRQLQYLLTCPISAQRARYVLRLRLLNCDAGINGPIAGIGGGYAIFRPFCIDRKGRKSAPDIRTLRRLDAQSGSPPQFRGDRAVRQAASRARLAPLWPVRASLRVELPAPPDRPPTHPHIARRRSAGAWFDLR